VRSVWPSIPDEFVRLLRGVLDGGPPVIDRYVRPSERGEVAHDVLGTYYGVRDADGQVVGIGVVSIDVHVVHTGDDRLRMVVAVQSALRRVATLVASAPEQQEVFDLVAAEVCELLGADAANLIRFDEPLLGTVVGGWSHVGADRAPTGKEVELKTDSAAAEVWSARRGVRFTYAPGHRSDSGGAEMRTAVAAPITVAGELWGAIVVASHREDTFPPGAETRLAGFAELVALAIANAESRLQLASSRARIINEADRARRKLERDLHDGAQQRLVSLALTMRLVETQLATDPAAAKEMLSGAREELAQALAELRELARGIHPAVLTQGGLGAAVEALADRAPMPVEVRAEPVGRLSEPVEGALYFVVSEALVNVAKHAPDASVDVRVWCDETSAQVEVRDDGPGGADPHGSGLRGLRDRLEALDGSLHVASQPDSGTLIRARVPLGWSPG
jgi:signal transduction histidine kinase